MNGWEAITWNVARTGGFTAYILLALSVAFGLALTLHWQAPRWPRLINSELHNFMSLLGTIFLGVHILAVWIDPFTRFGWNEVFIPLVSHYRSLWMAFGIVALYLGIAIGISTWLRPKIGYAWWRRLHVLTLLIYILATIHGIATGSDSRTWWGILIYGGSIALISLLLSIRLLVPSTARGKRHPALATLVTVSTVVLVAWMVVWPLQPGWNAVANNGQGSGARVALAASSGSHQAPQSQSKGNQNPFAAPFTSSLQGAWKQNGPDGSGVESLQMNTQLSGGAQGYLTVVLQGSSDGSGGLAISATQVTLGVNAITPLYQGQVTRLSDNSDLRITALLNPSGAGSPGTTASSAIQVRIVMQIAHNGQISGQVQSAPASGTNSNAYSNPNSNSNSNSSSI